MKTLLTALFATCLAGATAQVALQTDTATQLLGSPFEITLTLPGTDTASAILLPDSLGPLALFSTSPWQVTGSNSSLAMQWITLDSGYLVLQPLRLVVGADTLQTEPALIKSTFPPIEQGVDRKDLATPVAAPLDWRWVWAGSAAAALLAALVYFFLKRRKTAAAPQQPSAPPKSPLELALEELAALQARPLDSLDSHRHYAGSLVDLLRRYLSRSRSWSTLEATPEELWTLLQQSSAARKNAAEYKNFVQLSTLVKYAKEVPTAEESLRYGEWLKEQLHLLDHEHTAAHGNL